MTSDSNITIQRNWLILLADTVGQNSRPCASAEPASPSPDSEATMEVDLCDGGSDGGHSMDEQDELSTPDDKLFFIEGPGADGEKDDETLRAIRYKK